VTGHPEYDANTLASEFFRDVEAGLDPQVPQLFPAKRSAEQTARHLAKPWQSAVYQLAELLRLPDHAIRSTPYESDSGLIFYTTRS
jgi:homoserine O-succinyltransferase